MIKTENSSKVIEGLKKLDEPYRLDSIGKYKENIQESVDVFNNCINGATLAFVYIVFFAYLFIIYFMYQQVKTSIEIRRKIGVSSKYLFKLKSTLFGGILGIITLIGVMIAILIFEIAFIKY